jgi:hypothetical protein
MDFIPHGHGSDGQTVVMPDEGQELLQELDNQGRQAINDGFPGDVEDQRDTVEAFHNRDLVSQEHDFAHQQSADGGRQEKFAEIDMIIFQEEFLREHYDIKGHEEKTGGTDELQRLVFENVPEFGHR